MDLMALVLSFVAGVLFASVGIFWLLARAAPHMDGEIIEQLRRETDEAVPVDGGLVAHRGDQSLH